VRAERIDFQARSEPIEDNLKLPGGELVMADEIKLRIRRRWPGLFGITTVVLSSINAGLLPPEATPAVIPLAFSFGGFAQIIAGVLEYRTATPLAWSRSLRMVRSGGGMHSCFGPWVRLDKAADPRGICVALLMWGVFTLYMWIATFRTNFTLWTIFLLLWITFSCLREPTWNGAAWKTLGGWFGLATGLDALYLSFAEVTNATFGRKVIVVGGPTLKYNATI